MPSERRLHPLSFVFTIGSSLRSFLFPAILALFAVRSGNYDLFFAIFLIPYAAYSVIRYLTYRYSFGEEDLVVRTGLLFRNERHIPYARIHNVGAVQSIFHRLFGVVEVVLETAGGKEPEARLQVLSVRAMEEMKQYILRKKQAAGAVPLATHEEVPGAAPPAADVGAPRTLLRLPVSELMVLGLVENRGGVVVGAFIGVLWEVGFLGGGTSLSGFVTRAFSAASDMARPLMSFVQTGVLIAAVVLLILVLMRIFSMVWSVVKYWDFHLQRSGRDLTTTCGLLTRITATVPVTRIQVVSIRQRLLHRLLGRAELRVEIAGGGSEESAKNTTRPERLAPIIETEHLPALLQEIQPGIDLTAVRWQGVDPRAAGRILRKTLLFLAAPAAALEIVALLQDDGARLAVAVPILVALLIPLAWLNARMQAKHFGYAEESGVILFKSGWIWRRTSIARGSKIQVMTMTESFFDRRAGHAGVRIDTAGAGSAGHGLAIPYLPRDTARTIFDRLSAQAAHTAFRW